MPTNDFCISMKNPLSFVTTSAEEDGDDAEEDWRPVANFPNASMTSVFNALELLMAICRALLPSGFNGSAIFLSFLLCSLVYIIYVRKSMQNKTRSIIKEGLALIRPFIE
jgi:hypothetical protein